METEQQIVDGLYDRLDAAVSETLAARDRALTTSDDLHSRDVELSRLTRRLGELRAAERSLCFGRIDSTAGDFLHIGRVGLRSPDGEVVLVDWRADAARPFYAATPATPLGLRRRRHLRLQNRRVVDVSDEILDGSAPRPGDVVGDGPLTAALSRARTGRMREAVSTLQAEQDTIVRSPHRGVTVVDGGPGTGKTLVALHRAAYVLYAFPALAGRGVLVYGPNSRFLDYISDVLPSLGENDVRMATLADLVGLAPTAAEPEEAARAKGVAGTAATLAGRVRARQPRGVPLEVKVGQETLVLSAAEVDTARRHAVRDGLAHNPARAMFREYVVDALVDLLERRTADALARLDAEVASMLGVDLDEAVAGDLRSLGLDDAPAAGPGFDWDAVREQLLDDPAVDRAVEAVWPRLRPEDALGRTARTRADLALLDEARALVDGPPEEVYGHIVVDEAQELTEMEWRMLLRRCPSRSMTVVGDFAQSGSATTIRSWTEAVGERFVHHTLTVNYRTTAEILGHATPLLARIAPGQRPSRSVRHGEPPRTVTGDLETVRALAREEGHGLVGVIAPPGAAEALEGSGVTVVAAPDARGLEFDTVLVVDPAAIESYRESGPRDLYVALTRATRRLIVVTPAAG
ncbi:HelD family protein [Herbidospora daliensis]|uniref:HelD family protein n=1 Tax=Herbidospora daliensis TaxID=295585 RepID=UPI000A7CD783|nr:ATP-binding domain-containing protein [Herbidospora daliensis]